MRNPSGNRSLTARVAGSIAALVALALPALIAAELVRAAANPVTQLSSGLLAGQLLLAQASAPVSGANASTDVSDVTGVLYTRGGATIRWNGAEFPVRDGSYAYVGGELVTMGADGLGMLRLPDRSVVYLCPNSAARLTRTAGDGHLLELVAGTSRFVFPPQVLFTVRVRDATLRPPPLAQRREPVEAETEATADGNSLTYVLRSALEVSASGAGAGVVNAAAGQVVEVAAGAGAERIRTRALGAAAMSAALEPGADPRAPAYLCRARDLEHGRDGDQRPGAVLTEAGDADLAQRESEDATAAAGDEDGTATADGPDRAGTAPSGPAAAAGPDDLVPPVAPPDMPPAAIADAAPPDPFDPNVLPPPAAGEPTDPVVVVTPPPVPDFGAGGGGGGGAGGGAGGGGGSGPPASPS